MCCVCECVYRGGVVGLELKGVVGAGAEVSEDWLYRLLRAAVQMGVFDVEKDRRGGPVKFRNNSLSVVLREDHPNCMKYMVRATSPCRLVPSYITELV